LTDTAIQPVSTWLVLFFTMSSSPSVYIGKWTDHSHGQIMGSSITVTDQHGDYIISFLALFVGSFVMAAFWAIIRFIVHYCRAPRTESDGFRCQQQIVYRNNSDPLDAAMELFSICLAWKPFSSSKYRREAKVRRRSMWLLIPLVIFLSFQVAGILTSQIASSAYESSDVLVKPGNCGIWLYDYKSTNGVKGYELKVLNDTLTGRAYARSCYSTDFSSVNPVSCSFYTVKNLFYNSTAGDCPFGDGEPFPFESGICSINGNKESLVMDTGPLDSNDDFGINAPPKDRVKYRKQTTCSPVSVDGFSSVCTSPVASGLLYECYNLGPFQGQKYTYLYNPLALEANTGYQIGYVQPISNAHIYLYP
jgi:hypothetical protein